MHTTATSTTKAKQGAGSWAARGERQESDPEALGRLNLAGQDIQAKGWAHSDPGTARSGSHQASTRGIDRAGAGVVGEIIDACSAIHMGLGPGGGENPTTQGEAELIIHFSGSVPRHR